MTRGLRLSLRLLLPKNSSMPTWFISSAESLRISASFVFISAFNCARIGSLPTHCRTILMRRRKSGIHSGPIWGLRVGGRAFCEAVRTEEVLSSSPFRWAAEPTLGWMWGRMISSVGMFGIVLQRQGYLSTRVFSLLSNFTSILTPKDELAVKNPHNCPLLLQDVNFWILTSFEVLDRRILYLTCTCTCNPNLEFKFVKS